MRTAAHKCARASTLGAGSCPSRTAITGRVPRSRHRGGCSKTLHRSCMWPARHGPATRPALECLGRIYDRRGPRDQPGTMIRSDGWSARGEERNVEDRRECWRIGTRAGHGRRAGGILPPPPGSERARTTRTNPRGCSRKSRRVGAREHRLPRAAASAARRTPAMWHSTRGPRGASDVDLARNHHERCPRRAIRTACALDDDRFCDLGSVRLNEIRRAVCAPVDVRPARGAIYLQGTGPGMLLPLAGEQAELFARQLRYRLGNALDTAPSRRLREATLAFRRAYVLRVVTEMDGNVAAAARVLGIERSTLYSIVPELGTRRAADNDQGITS